MKNQDRVHRKGGNSHAVPQVETAPQSTPQIPPPPPAPGERVGSFNDALGVENTLYKVDHHRFIWDRPECRSEITRSMARDMVVSCMVPLEFNRDLSFPFTALTEMENIHCRAVALLMRHNETSMNPVYYSDDSLREKVDAGQAQMAVTAAEDLMRIYNRVWNELSGGSGTVGGER